MELKCKHDGNPSITKLIGHTQLHATGAQHRTQLNLYKSRTSRKNKTCLRNVKS